MSLLPTAHAGQGFGARRIDFYTVSGEVAASDAATGRVRDDDGIDHDVRLMERTSALAPGDNVTVLRVQSGPNRRSRPVALVNHSREVWVRAAPDATSLLARTGVTRSLNWWLSMLLLALTALAVVWPDLHFLLTELNGPMMAGIPATNIFAEINMLMPSLAGWRLEAALPGGMLDGIAALNVIETGQLTEWGLALGATLLTLLAFAARSWRLVYMPALVLFALASGAILGAPVATLAIAGGAMLFFMLAGLVNRIRDAGRFNARVERLAEHALRNPPQEGVRVSEGAAVTAIAAAAAMAQGQDDSQTMARDIQDDAEIQAEAEPANPADDAANGEAEASPPVELPPAAEAEPAEDDTVEAADTAAAGEVEAAREETGKDAGEPEEVEAVQVVETDAETDTVAADDAASDEADEPQAVDADDAEAVTETVDAVEAREADAEETVADVQDEPVAPLAPVAVEEDDDLPSLEAVAAAAALSASEQEGSPAEAPAEADPVAQVTEIDDDRTMALAPPPPMPARPATPPEETGDATASTPAAAEPHPTEATQPAPLEAEAQVVEEVAADAAEAGSPEPAGAPSDALQDVESRVAEAVEAAGRNDTPMIDDPLMADGPDPMVSSGPAGDLAPDAPELELDGEDRS
jgi:hypothetical protein